MHPVPESFPVDLRLPDRVVLFVSDGPAESTDSPLTKKFRLRRNECHEVHPLRAYLALDSL